MISPADNFHYVILADNVRVSDKSGFIIDRTTNKMVWRLMPM